MVDAYVSQFGTDINMKNIQVIRGQFPDLAGDASADAEEGSESEEQSATSMKFKFTEKAFSIPQTDSKLESPLYPRTVDCPVCRKWGVKSEDLRAKSLTIENDPFLAPVYRTTGRWREINYLLYNMTVCDSCLTSSPDRKDFVIYNPTTRQNQFSQLPMPVLKQLRDTTEQRKAFVEKSGVGDSLFKIPRSYAGAIVSYRLADMRAEIEADAKVMGAYYKRGNYWTRIALLCRQAGMKDEDRRALEIAVEHFKTAFMQSDFPKPELEFQSLFIIFSIYLFFEKQKEAMDYMNVLSKTMKELEKSGDPRNEALAHARKWNTMIRNRWDDRDYPEIWKTPGIV
jgi:uncharacterized protein (DUF2225 family)